jgi:uncharacterized protein YkwD
MRVANLVAVVTLAFVGSGLLVAQDDRAADLSAKEHMVMDLANEARAAEKLPPLKWDEALASAARAHSLKMSGEGALSHRYGGEQDVPERTAAAGAHFNLVEENIAIGHSPKEVHDEWMKSQMHHDNMMNPKVDRIGVGLVSARGVLYATADYSAAVQNLDAGQEEAKVAVLLKAKGLTLLDKAEDARKYCALEDGAPAGTPAGMKPLFLMRWQASDLTRLPDQLETKIATGRYKQAVVGACAPHNDHPGTDTFTSYRVAVLLY